MKNDNNCVLTKRIAAYYIYMWLYMAAGLLSLDHLLYFGKDYLTNELLQALIWGFIVATGSTFGRIRRGQCNDQIVNLKRDKYYAFAQLTIFYAVLMLAGMHIYDSEGAYMISELIFTAFFGLFGASITVLYLIKR